MGIFVERPTWPRPTRAGRRYEVAGSVDSTTARTPFGFTLAAGAVLMVATVTVAGGLSPVAAVRRAVVAAVLAGYAAMVVDGWAALATTGLGALLFDGFLVNQFGELTWDGTTSMWYLIVFAAALMLGRTVRWFWTGQAATVATLDVEMKEIQRA